MPARTNDFQKLVKIINRSLAPVGAKITESAMLYDAESKTDREIDILIESKILNCNIKIGVECTASNRPLDIKYIESVKEKHRKVGINQTIIVSKNGFTKSAKEYSIKNHIKLLTFNSAKSENWSKNFERLKSLSMYARNYFLRSLSVIMPKETDIHFTFNESTFVIQSDTWISLQDFVRQSFMSSSVNKTAAKELQENEARGSEPWIEIGFDLQKKFEFKDQDGRLAKPDVMVVVMCYISNYRNLAPRQVEYDSNEIVVGGFFDEHNHEFAHVAIKESEKQLIATVEFSENLFPSQRGKAQ